MDEILLDHQLQESLFFKDSYFPIIYYVDNLNQWADCTVPLHWHLGYEFFSAVYQDIEVQIGHETRILFKGESILIMPGQLHSYRSTSPGGCCLCPNIVFKEDVFAPMGSTIFSRYFSALSNDATLPYVIFSNKKKWHTAVLKCLFNIYALLTFANEKYAYDNPVVIPVKSECPEIEIHQNMLDIFKTLYCYQSDLKHTESGNTDRQTLIRLQKMISYIQRYYAQSISLKQVSASAGISRSEAGRCFKKYFAQSPMNYVILYRLKCAQELLTQTSLSINEIAYQCGFNDASYFVKVFKKHLNLTPSEYRKK